MLDRRKQNISKMLKEKKKGQLRILKTMNVSFQNESEIKFFQIKKRSRR